jgi:lipase maturation factor 1
MNLRHVLNKSRELLARPPALTTTEAVFLRLLGLIYLISFASFWPQIVGLVGSHGISPANSLVAAVRAQYGAASFWHFPTLFLFRISDGALVACCVAGCIAALLMVSGLLTRLAAFLCWLLYLSIVMIGQPFSNFQWDALLLEAGFLAIFAGSPLLVWAYRFLLFRLMFESGIVKLTSHDPNWRNFHALRFHFFTQPLPTPLAYYANLAPGWLLDSMTVATFVIELLAPFLLFGPRLLRYTAVALFMLLQVLILLTGNYAFFNLLTLALCFWGLDDAVFAPLARWLKTKPLRPEWARVAASAALVLLMFAGAVEMLGMMLPSLERPSLRIREIVGPFEIVNDYGLFAIMTTTRDEIVLEGSDDATHWLEYSFRYKPGDPRRGLPLVAPYQPRLDWQMWFAALGTYNENTWMGGLLYRLLTGEPSVLALLESPPFPKPPKYMRAQLYDYRFTTPDERRRTGAVWQRRLIGSWFGPVSLKGQ